MVSNGNRHDEIQRPKFGDAFLLKIPVTLITSFYTSHLAIDFNLKITTNCHENGFVIQMQHSQQRCQNCRQKRVITSLLYVLYSPLQQFALKTINYISIIINKSPQTTISTQQTNKSFPNIMIFE